MTDVVTTKLVQDRLYAINQTIPAVTVDSHSYTINAVRYFPQGSDSSLFPYLFSLPERRFQDNATSGVAIDRHTRQYRLYLVVESWGGGIPTETGQRQAEAFIDAVPDIYLACPHLELAHVALDGVIDSRLTEDTGIIAFGPELQLAAIQYVLSVTTINPYSYQ